MSADKSEAQRLADALQKWFPTYGWLNNATRSDKERLAQEAAALLRRWPDGEPVGKVLTEAEMGIGWDGRAGNILWWRKPDAPALLYTAQPVKPDGEPVAWLYEARYIDTAWTVCVGLNNPGPEGAYLRGVRPLYTAPPAESERIAALEAENAELRAANKRAMSSMRDMEAALAERDRVIEQARVALEEIAWSNDAAWRTERAMQAAIALRKIEEVQR